MGIKVSLTRPPISSIPAHCLLPILGAKPSSQSATVNNVLYQQEEFLPPRHTKRAPRQSILSSNREAKTNISLLATVKHWTGSTGRKKEAHSLSLRNVVSAPKKEFDSSLSPQYPIWHSERGENVPSLASPIKSQQKIGGLEINPGHLVPAKSYPANLSKVTIRRERRRRKKGKKMSCFCIFLRLVFHLVHLPQAGVVLDFSYDVQLSLDLFPLSLCEEKLYIVDNRSFAFASTSPDLISALPWLWSSPTHSWSPNKVSTVSSVIIARNEIKAYTKFLRWGEETF